VTFVGRRAELAALADWWEHAADRPTLIWGAAGRQDRTTVIMAADISLTLAASVLTVIVARRI